MTTAVFPSRQLDFFRAIHAAPDCDATRLIYADWLEENGDKARAEFIRVQVELAVAPPAQSWCERAQRIGEVSCITGWKRSAWCAGCVKLNELRRRESALLRDHGERWRCPGACERCGGSGYLDRSRRVELPHVGKRAWTFSGESGRCPTCHGTGLVGALADEIRDRASAERWIAAAGMPLVPSVSWSRGFAVVKCPVAWWCEEKRECIFCKGNRFGGQMHGVCNYETDYPNARRVMQEQGYITLELTGDLPAMGLPDELVKAYRLKYPNSVDIHLDRLGPIAAEWGLNLSFSGEITCQE